MGRRINIMLGRVSVADGTGSMEGANAQTLVVRVSSAVGSVRTKAIKKRVCQNAQKLTKP